MRGLRRHPVLGALVVLVAALAVACGGGDPPPSTSDTTTTAAPPETTTTTEAPVEAGQVLYVYRPGVGDCFDRRRLEPEAGGDRIVLLLDCSLPHTHEVFWVFDVTAEDLERPDGTPPEAGFPGEDPLIDAAKRRCTQPFAEFVGLPYERSALELGWVVPTPGQWDDGNRTIGCTVYDAAGGRLVDSQAGTAR
jgi:hypothetical protein